MPTLDELIDLYRATLVEMDDIRRGSSNPRDWNRLVDRMQWFQLALRESEGGRAAITHLIDDACPTVREWSTTNALAWDPEISTAALHEQIAGSGRSKFEAKLVLRDYESGRLNTAWTPRGRRPKELGPPSKG